MTVILPITRESVRIFRMHRIKKKAADITHENRFSASKFIRTRISVVHYIHYVKCGTIENRFTAGNYTDPAASTLFCILLAFQLLLRMDMPVVPEVGIGKDG